MQFFYCPECGRKLEPKQIGDEGMVPYCDECGRPFFSFSYPCVICLAVNEEGKVALIKQSYGKDIYVLVAGFIKPDEDAETAAIREIEEEIGQRATDITYVGSYTHPKRDNLMLGYTCRVSKHAFELSGEVKSAKWFTVAEALKNLKDAHLARTIVEDSIKKGLI